MSQSIEPHAVEHTEGVHLPKPSIMPLIWGAGFMLIAFSFITQIYYLLAAGLAVILAATGGWLWGNIRERLQPTETPAVAAKFAMWCFLGTEVIIFGALIGRVVAIWFHEPEAHSLLTEPLASLLLVSANTFILLLSSLAVVLGLNSIQTGRPTGLARWLTITALLGATFVGIQAYEYSKLMREGLNFGSSQFASAFYILTGNHGLHVTAGVIWSLVLVVRTRRGGFTAGHYLGVEIFGLFWHFVDVVWIIIFTLVYLI